jgi:hypothetical protein
MGVPLSIWVVYERPRDYPQHYVVREWTCDNPSVAKQAWFFSSLDLARAALAASGLTCLMPFAGDDPCIVETWI